MNGKSERLVVSTPAFLFINRTMFVDFTIPSKLKSVARFTKVSGVRSWCDHGAIGF